MFHCFSYFFSYHKQCLLLFCYMHSVNFISVRLLIIIIGNRILESKLEKKKEKKINSVISQIAYSISLFFHDCSIYFCFVDFGYVCVLISNKFGSYKFYRTKNAICFFFSCLSSFWISSRCVLIDDGNIIGIMMIILGNLFGW